VVQVEAVMGQNDTPALPPAVLTIRVVAVEAVTYTAVLTLLAMVDQAL